MGWDWLVPFSSYSEFWRQARRLLDRGLRPGAAATYRPMQQSRARLLLTRMLASPDKWEDHIELFVTQIIVLRLSIPQYHISLQGEMILSLTYGYDAEGPDDRKLYIVKKMAHLASTTTLPGALLVNSVPFCE
jgi:hypothetical protein